MSDCLDRENERAWIGRVHSIKADAEAGPHTGASIASGTVISNHTFNCMSIEKGSALKLEQLDLVNFMPSGTATLALNDVRVVITNTELGSMSPGSTFDLTDLTNYEGLQAVIDIDDTEWKELVADTVAIALKNKIDLNLKTASDNKQLFAYVITNEIQTIPANVDYMLKLKVTKD